MVVFISGFGKLIKPMGKENLFSKTKLSTKESIIEIISLKGNFVTSTGLNLKENSTPLLLTDLKKEFSIFKRI